MKPTLQVLVDPPYPVYVGAGLLEQLPQLTNARNVAIVSEQQVAALHLAKVRDAFSAMGREVIEIIVPAGEASKSTTEWSNGLRTLAQYAFRRDDCIIALGGGVVGDLAGFIAASYARGIDLIQAPTSVLAMADAAVGGKTGINLPEGKNLVGAFWQPKAVVMDVSTLSTLPPNLFDHGLVEMFKHGLLARPDLLDALLDPNLGPLSSTERLIDVVTASVAVKARVVAQDEHETGEARAMLNLGHTVAHALEAITNHDLTHGEAVAWGLLYAAHLSHLNPKPGSQEGGHVDWRPWVRRLIARIQPSVPPALSWEDVLVYLERDKKNRRDSRRWVLANAPGDPWLASDVPEHMEQTAWAAFREEVDHLPPQGSRRATLGSDEESV